MLGPCIHVPIFLSYRWLNKALILKAYNGNGDIIHMNKIFKRHDIIFIYYSYIQMLYLISVSLAKTNA